MFGLTPSKLLYSNEEVSRGFPDLGFPYIWQTDVLAVAFTLIILSRRGQDKDNRKKLLIYLLFWFLLLTHHVT